MKKQPMTWFNRILFALLALTVGFALWRDQWGIAIGLLLGIAVMFPLVRRAQKGKDTPFWRVSLMQPYDERDQHLDMKSSALLGKTLFICQALMFLVAMILGRHMIEEGVRLLALCLVLGVVQFVAVKRG